MSSDSCFWLVRLQRHYKYRTFVNIFTTSILLVGHLKTPLLNITNYQNSFQDLQLFKNIFSLAVHTCISLYVIAQCLNLFPGKIRKSLILCYLYVAYLPLTFIIYNTICNILYIIYIIHMIWGTKLVDTIYSWWTLLIPDCAQRWPLPGLREHLGWWE